MAIAMRMEVKMPLSFDVGTIIILISMDRINGLLLAKMQIGRG